MKRSVLVLTVLALLAILVGCGGKKEPKDWNATVDVKGTTATVTVTVPGMRMGKDYHPHVVLNGGPEIMLYSSTYTFQNLKPGSHQVLVNLSDPEHNPLPGMEKTLQFEVK